MGELTEKIKVILDTPLADVDLNEAALILLQVNRNQILYNNILAKQWKEKAVYELQKIYDFRMKEDALVETAKMEKEVEKVIELNPELTAPAADDEDEEPAKGKRSDHDELPDDIKALFVENLHVFREMRKLHEQLKLMRNHKPCDRYPFLKELLELDKQHRANWDAYDAFVFEQKDPEPKQEDPAPEDRIVTETIADPKLVSAARKYLSTNKAKVAALEGEAKQELLAKMQERYSYLVATNSGISDEQKAEFKTLGLNV